MADENGEYRQIVHDLVEAARLNLDEHEKIWSAVNALRVSHLDLIGQIANLTGAIRDLIDRIPPENLR
jgi:hypothetical protein